MDTLDKANVELKETNDAISSKLKELKSSKKELKDKHDKLEGMHKQLITSHNMLKEEYTTLKINHDNLVIAQEYLSNEPHDATNNVVKIDIATSCDDLIIESIDKVLVARVSKWLKPTTMMSMSSSSMIIKSSRKILKSSKPPTL